jgi:hypothetical protein
MLIDVNIFSPLKVTGQKRSLSSLTLFLSKLRDVTQNGVVFQAHAVASMLLKAVKCLLIKMLSKEQIGAYKRLPGTACNPMSLGTCVYRISGLGGPVWR